MKARYLFAGCAGIASALVSAAASAQSTSTEAAPVESLPAETNAESAPLDSAPAESMQPAGDEGLQDIVVTAQRRAENLQNAALSVTALTPEVITQGSATQVASLTSLVPGLQASRQGFNTSLFIRGIGTTQGAAIYDPAIAFNLNGVYISRTGAINGQLFDIERVEVLKGPQGTLYGRNASGGAINVITRRPSLNGEIEGFVGGELGNYDRQLVTGAVTLPLGSSTAVRGAFQVVHRDGYFDDGSDDESSQSFRLTGRTELSDTLSATLIGHYIHIGGDGAGAALLPLGTTPIRGGLGNPAVTALFVNDPLNRILPPFLQPAIRPMPQDQIYMDIDIWGITGEFEWSTPIGTLTVLPAYQKLDQRVLSTSQSFWFRDETNQEQYSAEARLTSDQDQRLRWLIGAYYLHDENNYAQVTDTQFLGAPIQIGHPENETAAVFGQLSFSLNDTFRLVGSARYTYEKKSLEGQQDRLYISPASSPVVPNPIVLVPGPLPTPDFFIDSSGSWKNATWKAGFEWDAADRSLVYGNISTGFKAGGFFGATSNNSYNPEKVTAYTLGTKNRFFDNALQLNAELFWLDYKDQQLAFYSNIDAGGVMIPGFATRNVGASTIKGASVDLLYLLTHNTQLQLQAEYLDSTYDNFVYRSPDTSPLLGLPPGAVAPLTGCNYTLDGSDFVVDCSGRTSIQAPKWVISGGVEQTFPLSNGAEIVLNLRSRYEGKRWTSSNLLPQQLADSNTKTDASLAYRADGSKWEIALFVNNIENDDVPELSYPSPLYPLFNLVTTTLRPPRIYGLRLNFNF